MPISQKIFAFLVSLGVILVVIEMVRRRRLREEYSVLWLATSAAMMVLIMRYDWLVWLTHFTGAKVPTTILFIGSIIFLVLVAVQFSVKLSKMTDQIKNLAQENALLRADLESLPQRGAPGKSTGGDKREG
jgi:hypothetical protein